MTNFFQSLALAALFLALRSITAQAQEPLFTPTPHPMVEEATGSWCGYCVRGWIGMHELQKKYPDAVVAVWHNGDPMSITDAYPFKYGGGFPGAAINRTLNALDPFFGSSDSKDLGIEDDYLKALDTPAVADLDVTAQYNDARDSIIVTSDLHFAETGVKCKVGYLLIANGYNHPDEGAWAQKNFYSGKSTSGILSQLNDMPELINDFTYNDVVIYAKELRGILGSLPDTVQPDARLSHRYAIPAVSIKSMKKIEILEDRDNLDLHVVCYLLNKLNRVTNARRVAVGSSTVTGINAIATDDTPALAPAVYYDLSGRRVDNPQHGLFIKKEGSKAAKVIL